MTSLSAVILAGGESRRMGRDKSRLLIHGQPMLSWVIQALQPLDIPILLVTNTPDVHAAFALPMVNDVTPNLGAMGGLYTALTHIATESALVVACDMPRLQPALLAHLADLATHITADALVPRLEGRAHPLHAVYRRHILPTLHTHINAGRLSLNACLSTLNVHWLDEPDLRPYDPMLVSMTNLNTPDDVTRLTLPPTTGA